MSVKTTTVKVTDINRSVIAEVTLTPLTGVEMGGAEAAWTVTLDGVVIGKIDKRRESQMYAIAGSRLGSPGAVRTYWDAEGPRGLRDKATHTTYNETRNSVLLPLVVAHRERVATAKAIEEAKGEQHWLRVHNVPGYAIGSRGDVVVPDGVIYAGYWMGDNRVPVAVFRSTDAAALAAFGKTIEGNTYWENDNNDRAVAHGLLTDDAKVATEGHGWDALFDHVTKVAAR